MSNSPAVSPVLPMAQGLLRVLGFINWCVGAALFGLLLSPHQEWVLKAFKIPPSPDADRWVVTIRIIAFLGLICVPINRVILRRLFAMVETVREGNPFVASNAQRLRTVAWCMVWLQLMSIAIGELARSLSTPVHPLHLDAGFSFTGWLAVLLTFLLAGVFAEGTRMRDELEGTV
jgi:hypothetical protein